MLPHAGLPMIRSKIGEHKLVLGLRQRRSVGRGFPAQRAESRDYLF
jgi:hypothetical protein